MNITKIIAVAFASFALVACGGEEAKAEWSKEDKDAFTKACTETDKKDAKTCECLLGKMGDVAWADSKAEADSDEKKAYDAAAKKAGEECAKS